MLLFAGSITCTVVVSALCSLMEATLLSLTPSQVAELSLQRPKVGTIWHNFKNNIEQPIAFILILNTAALTIGASIAGSQFHDIFGEGWIWLYSLLFTFLLLQFAEILPKALGVRHNRVLALHMAGPLAAAIRFSQPLIKIAYWVNRPFKGRFRKVVHPTTLEEIASLAAMARLAKQIGSHQERIIREASHLSIKRISQVMIPLEQVSFLSSAQTVNDALSTAVADSHTRFPVCEEGDKNRVVGYVNVKELVYFIRSKPDEQNLANVIRPLLAVSQESTVADQLKDFVKRHVHIAIVKDDQNRTMGLVTLEDLLEELVGEVLDEFDRLPRHIHPVAEDSWLAGGGVAITEISALLGVSLPEAADNLADWLEKKLGPELKPGQTHIEAGFQFTIRRVRRARPFEIAIQRVRS